MNKSNRNSHKKISELTTIYGFDWIFEINLLGEFISLNNKTLKFTGFEIDELKGKFIFDYINKEKSNQLKRIIENETISTDFLSEFDFVFLKNNNEQIWLTANILRFVENETNNLRFICTYKKSCDEIGAINEHIFDNIKQKIFIKDSDSTYIFCNKSFANSLGMTTDEIIGKNDFDFFPTELAEKYILDDKKLMTANQGDEFNQRYFENNEIKWIHTIKTPFKDKNGKVIGISGIFWDLKQHEKNYETAIKTAIDGFIIIGDNYKILEVNDSICKMSGYTRNELLDKKINDNTINYDLNKIEKIKEELRNNGFSRHEYKIKNKYGKNIDIDLSLTYFPDSNLTYAFVKDISDKIKLQNNLKNEKDILDSIINGIDDFIYMSSPETHEILKVNKKFEEIFGKDTIGKKCYKVIHKKDKPCSFCTNEIILNSTDDKPHIWEYKNEVTNRWYRCTDKAIRWSDGKKIRFEIAIDITDLKTIQHNLELSENKFKSYFENSSVGKSITGLDGTLMINKAFADMLGYSVEELMNRKWAEITHPEDIKESEDIAKFLVDGSLEKARVEKRYFHKNGSIVWTEIFSTLQKDKNGTPLYLITAVNDITRRKEIEEELLKSYIELKRSNQELEQFAYVASHDLQEPLRMVASFTQLLSQKYSGKLDDKADLYIKYAVDGATRMQELINDLLDFSRITTRGNKFEPTDINEVIEQTLLGIKKYIEDNNAVVFFSDLPTINIDKGQIIRVFQNLITNGIKYNQSEIPTIVINAKKDTNKWLFEIKDNGIGIDEKYMDKIFVIFQRLHTKEEYSGTGIGLAITKRIINRHNGEIWFKSTINKGTSFFFTIPI